MYGGPVFFAMRTAEPRAGSPRADCICSGFGCSFLFFSGLLDGLQRAKIRTEEMEIAHQSTPFSQKRSLGLHQAMLMTIENRQRSRPHHCKEAKTLRNMFLGVQHSQSLLREGHCAAPKQAKTTFMLSSTRYFLLPLPPRLVLHQNRAGFQRVGSQTGRPSRGLRRKLPAPSMFP